MSASRRSTAKSLLLDNLSLKADLQMRRTLSAKEFPGDVESFTADYHNFLAIEQLLGYSAS